MSGRPSVSVCVPTCNRPRLLGELLASVFAQEFRPIELLMSDDSADDATANLIAGLVRPTGLEIGYWRNDPALGQAASVNRLFDRAAGSHVLLIHDDDLLLPGCIAALARALEEHPAAVAAYGRQRLIDDDGTDRGQAEADRLNAMFHRTPQSAGVQHDSLSMAILRQFPNDGFLLRSDVARAVRYRPPAEVGQACDADFAVRVGLAHPKEAFVLVDAETCAYRLSRASIARNGSAAAASHYRLLQQTPVPPYAEAARQQALAHLAPDACGDLLRLGRCWEAVAVWLGKSYGLRRFRPRGLVLAASAAVPGLHHLLRTLRNVLPSHAR